MPHGGAFYLNIVLYYIFSVLGRGKRDCLQFVNTKKHAVVAAWPGMDVTHREHEMPRERGVKPHPKNHLFFTCRRLEGFDSI